MNIVDAGRCMNALEAEFCGMHAGDGTLYRTNGSSIVWELRGGLDETAYYHEVVVPLVKKLFGIDLVPKHRSGGGNGSFGVVCCKRKLTSFLHLDFPVGSKSRIVRVPYDVMMGTHDIKGAFLRGLFDTDGSFRLDKNHTSRYCYPKIEWCTASPGMLEDVRQLLRELGIDHITWDNRGYHMICINGWSRLQKFMDVISFHNPKHLNKVAAAMNFKRGLCLVRDPSICHRGTTWYCAEG